jgi:hypothetical protein
VRPKVKLRSSLILLCDPAVRDRDLAYLLGMGVGFMCSFGIWWIIGAVIVSCIVEVAYETWGR